MKKLIYCFLLLIPVIIIGQAVNFQINAKDFSFAVLGDRTGSAEQQVFLKIIERIKLLKPDFVINVGDLIEGYTQNFDLLNNQWVEIFSYFGELSPKFFFTPGTHDAVDSLHLEVYLSRVGYK
ncbi:MAG: metallophosphoesterase, partial [candidate division WOR-3 bacterium]|nr:metallophosphoesterase [candidate division WOR-3 bacterium]